MVFSCYIRGYTNTVQSSTFCALRVKDHCILLRHWASEYSWDTWYTIIVTKLTPTLGNKVFCSIFPRPDPTYVTNLILSSHFLLKINIGCHYRLPCLLGEVFFSTGSLRVFVEYIICDVLSCFTLCRSCILNLFVFMIYVKNITIQECSVLFVNRRQWDSLFHIQSTSSL